MTDAALARRRLHELRAKVARLNQTPTAGTDFGLNPMLAALKLRP